MGVDSKDLHPMPLKPVTPSAIQNLPESNLLIFLLSWLLSHCSICEAEMRSGIARGAVMRRVEAKRLCVSVMITIVAMYLAGSSSLAAELDEVQAAIAAKGKSWIAGETSVSKLSDEEMELRAGVIQQVMTGEEQVLSPEQLLADVPASLDWRSNGGTFVTPVRDQGRCNSCYAFSTTAALESYVLIKENRPDEDEDRSEQILISCDDYQRACEGGHPWPSATYILSTGLPPESYFPYGEKDMDCRDASEGWRDYTYRIASWSYVATDTTSVDALKSCLYTYGPLPTIMNIYKDFYYYKSGVYEYTNGKYVGQHAVLIVGYSDNSSIDGGGYFIVKNSWGTEWGLDG